MIELIITSLLISAYIIFDDMLFDATLKSNTPPTSAQLYLDCDLSSEDADFEDYCNYRMNNKGVASAPETKHRTAITFFQE